MDNLNDFETTVLGVVDDAAERHGWRHHGDIADAHRPELILYDKVSGMCGYITSIFVINVKTLEYMRFGCPSKEAAEVGRASFLILAGTVTPGAESLSAIVKMPIESPDYDLEADIERLFSSTCAIDRRTFLDFDASISGLFGEQS